MISQFILGLTSILTSFTNTTPFTEQAVFLNEGQTTLQAEMPWNMVLLKTKDGSDLPELSYKYNNEFFLMTTPDIPVPEGKDPERWITKALRFDTLRTDIVIDSKTQTNVIAQFFNTQNQTENLVAQSGITDFDAGIDFNNFEFGDTLLDGVELTNFKNGTLLGNFGKSSFRPQYITRAGWNADESLRIWKRGRGLKKYFRSTPPEAKMYLSKEDWPVVTQKQDSKGNKLTWPIEKNKTIKKIVIHHTGEYIDNTKQVRLTPKEHMRAIYQYHTLGKQWGDIGYNFVIDKKGNIYEGRAGGPTTVSAHTAYYNAGTIGIALMGNFNVEEPTDRQIKVVTILSAYLSDKYNIDPQDTTNFLGITSKNLTGHRFVARKEQPTSGPGINFIKRLPEIQKATKLILKQLQEQRDGLPKGLDFLSKSKTAPKYQRRLPRFAKKEKTALIAQSGFLNRKIIQRGDSKLVAIRLQNNTKNTWKRYTTALVIDAPEGMTISPIKAVSDIAPKESGFFQGLVTVNDTKNGRYDLRLDPVFMKNSYFDYQTRPYFQIPIQVSGSRNLLLQKPSQKPYTGSFSSLTSTLTSSAFTNKQTEREIKVKLAFVDTSSAILQSNKPVFIRSKNKTITELKTGEIITVTSTSSNSLDIKVKEKTWSLNEVSFITDGYLEIINYNRGLSKKIRYNKFRRQLNMYPQDIYKLLVVNQLPLEEYLAGLAEEPKTEPTQKKHAIHVLARSYAFVYSGDRRKFKTRLYDLEDDPKSSQFYLGYDWERLHQEQKKLLKETAGVVLMRKNTPIIGPYFTQSSGQSSGKWKKTYPWAKVQPLPFDKGLVQKGHGVGLSGNSARELAKQGKKFPEIINYFFEGVKVKKIY